MDCVYILNDKEYTEEELINYLSEKGLGELTPPESPELKLLIEKYDFSKYEESIAEMIARLNYQRDNPGKELPKLDAKTVKSLIYPKGELTDYMTQRDIHANTYSGMRITGISANSGKMAGYMFESTPIKSLRDGDEVFTPTKNLLLSKYGVESVNELLSKYPNVKVEEREIPNLKNPIVIDNKSYKGMSRLENKTNLNIFELIDMIINLAIDNVKEQKLFVLGITNSNANAFLASLMMGIPLRDVVRMFQSKTFKELATKSRITKDDYQKVMQDSLPLTVQDAAKALDNFYDGNIPTAYQKQIGEDPSLNTYIKIFKSMSPSMQVLEDLYTGKKKDSSLSDYLVAKELSKLADIGDEFFTYAQLFSLLRTLPSSKARIDYLISRVNHYNEFSYLSTAKEAIGERIIASIKDQIITSETYLNLKDSDPEAAQEFLNNQLKALKDSTLFKNTRTLRASSWFANRVMRSSGVMHVSPSSNSNFTNVVPLNIPHVFQAYKSMLTLNSILESGFFVYSPVLAKKLHDILKNIGKIGSNKTIFSYSVLDQAANEFLKFISSNVSFNVDGVDVDLDTSKMTERVVVRGVTYTGVEAWSQQFIKRLLDKKNSNDLVYNMEIITDDATGLHKLALTSDKVNDDEVRESLISSYEDLLIDSPQLALDLFRYAILTQGLAYGRTALGRIFPSRLIVNFSKAMEERISVIKGGSDVDFMKNIEAIEDQFVHQYVSSDLSSLPFVAGLKPSTTSSYKKGGRSLSVLRGVDVVNEQEVYYDLKYPKAESTNYPKIIKRFDDKIYIKLDVNSDSYVYYRVFAIAPLHHTYSFSPSDLEKGLNLEILVNPNLNVLYGVTPTASNAFQITGPQVVTEGEIVYIPAYKGSTPIELIKGKITTITPIIRNEEVVAVTYSYSFMEKISLTNERKILENESIASPLDVASRESAVSVLPVSKIISRKSKNSIVIANDLSTLVASDNVVILPINELTSNPSKIDDVLRLISSLPSKARYIAQENILGPLKVSNPVMARTVAQALMNSVSYVDPILDDVVFTTEERLFAEIDYLINRNEFIPYNSISHEGENIYVDLGAVPFSVKNKASEGRMLKMFNTENGVAYGYIKEITDNKAVVIPFGIPTLQALTQSKYSLDEFMDVLEKTQPC